MKILRIKDEWVIRGTKELPRLYNWHNNKTIKLNNEILGYIRECNGTLTINEICKKNNLNIEIANNFYKQFVEIGAIELIDEINKREVEMDLGEREPWLREVHLDVTDHCNLRCRHCFWGDNLTYNKNLPAKNWKLLLKDLRQMGVGKVVVSGGEAFTREDLMEIVSACYTNKLFVGAIFTNGTLKTSNIQQVVDFVINKKLETSFYISMDGYTEEQNDFIRGDGKFKYTLSFVEMLVKRRKYEGAKYKILINSLIHQKNYNHLIEWYEFLQNLGVDSWRFTTGRITGQLEKNVSEIKIDISKYFPEYIDLAKYAIKKYKTGNYINLNIENFFNTKYLERGKIFLFEKNNAICDYKKNACSIDPYGNVQFCTGWQNVKYGNVFENNISKIWYSNKLQKVKNFKINEISECQECKYLKYCGGGCRLECSSMYAKDKFLCESFRFFDEYMIPLLREQKIEFVGENHE